MDWQPSAFDWEQSEANWEQSVSDWEPSVMDWEQSVSGWEPSVTNWEPSASDKEQSVTDGEQSETHLTCFLTGLCMETGRGRRKPTADHRDCVWRDNRGSQTTRAANTRSYLEPFHFHVAQSVPAAGSGTVPMPFATWRRDAAAIRRRGRLRYSIFGNALTTDGHGFILGTAELPLCPDAGRRGNVALPHTGKVGTGRMR